MDRFPVVGQNVSTNVSFGPTGRNPPLSGLLFFLALLIFINTLRAAKQGGLYCLFRTCSGFRMLPELTVLDAAES